MALDKDKINEGINESGDEEDQTTGAALDKDPSTPKNDTLNFLIDDQQAQLKAMME